MSITEKKFQKILKFFFRNSKTKICHNFNQNMDFLSENCPIFVFFGKLSVFSVIKVGFRFYSVIRISVSVRFRLDQIWSVSVRLSVNRLFEPITKLSFREIQSLLFENFIYKIVLVLLKWFFVKQFKFMLLRRPETSSFNG